MKKIILALVVLGLLTSTFHIRAEHALFWKNHEPGEIIAASVLRRITF